MPLIRLLVVVTLFSCCAGPALAQSPQNDTAGVAASQDHSSINTSGNPEADQFRLSPYPQIEFSLQNKPETDPPARHQVDEYAYPHDRELPQPRVHKLPPGWQLPSDTTCYSIRSYLVVRDSPHSDTTHRDGYSTCVPTARFHMYSATYNGR